MDENKVTPKVTVLLVDDEEMFRTVLRLQIKLIVKDQELEFIEACDGEGAWQLLKGGLKPSIIILDYAMPRINGIELLRKIYSETSGLADVPCIMISGYCQEEIVNEAQRLRCTFFQKGFDPKNFFQHICDCIATKLSFSNAYTG